ncbi:MAG: UvrD-helicase domain-containing protein [Tidjanibacter sp.]|nr:UvrD-helicase domain-containing protein [Tidjanibacter sp.]
MGRVDILSASAGSGKTYRLAYSYIKTLLEEPNNYRHILAVTFTNKATDELKSRILTQLNLLAKGEKSDFDGSLNDDGYDMEFVRRNAATARNLILHDYNNFAVMTIDKFFQRVMRAFIKEIGIELNFNLELHTDSLLDEAADRMLDEVASDRNLYAWIMNYIGDNISEGASWNIKSAIVELGKELFGEEYKHAQISSEDKPELERLSKEMTAKAKALTKDYRHLAQEFISLMDAHALTAGDFKGGERSGVASYIQKVASGIIEKPSKAALNALENDEWHKAGKSDAFYRIDTIAPQLRDIITRMVALYPKAIVAENTRKVIASHYRDFALLADLRTRIDAICTEGDILPISDVGELIASLVADNDAPFIYEKSGNRYDYFMIDEFQDTSTMQWRNFTPLLHNALAQSAGAPVLLVGDIKQSIYRWRGGDWSLLASGVESEFGDVKYEPLKINRRSTKEVVEFNNGLTEAAMNSISDAINKELETAHSKGYISTSLQAQLGSMVTDAYKDYEQTVKENAGTGYVTVLDYDKKRSPNPTIARIEELQSRGYRASDIAVLVRTNREARKIAAEILEHKNSPERDPRFVFDVVTQEALAINASPAVRFVIACMQIASSPEDRLARALYNDYFSRPFEESLSHEEEEFIFSLATLQPEEVFNEIMLHYPTCASKSEVPYLQALHSQIIDFCSKNIADTSLFVKWWNEKGSSASVQLPQDADAITIITIHKSKGLGFKAVIIPYCSWSLRPMNGSTLWAEPNTPLSENITKFPASFNKAMAESEFSHSYYTELTMAAIDSLNTLYVAITRAKQELHIMVPRDASSTTVGDIVRKMTGISEENPTYEMGTPEQQAPRKLAPQSISEFGTHSPEEKIAVRYSHQRYDEESVGDYLAPRDYGILMHKVMENATSREEMERSLGLLVTDGVISTEEAQTLTEKINKAMEDERVAEWFDGSWDSVRGERDIIHNGRSWRPDRVMIRGEEAVVVDYKFGINAPASYHKQIERYADLLRQMGYKSVSGYLWYISTEHIEQVV